MLIYIYDLKTSRKSYNNLKRNFYYSFNKLSKKFKRRTKSVIMVEEENEKEMDKFFLQWKGFIELYKIRTNSIEQMLNV